MIVYNKRLPKEFAILRERFKKLKLENEKLKIENEKLTTADSVILSPP